MTQNVVCKPEHSAFAPSQGVEGLGSTLVKSEVLYLIAAFTYPFQGALRPVPARPQRRSRFGAYRTVWKYSPAEAARPRASQSPVTGGVRLESGGSAAGRGMPPGPLCLQDSVARHGEPEQVFRVL